MNSLENLQRYLKQPGTTEFEQLIQFIEYAGQSRSAPQIVSEEAQQRFSSFETCSDMSEVQHWPTIVAPAQMLTNLSHHSHRHALNQDTGDSLAAISDGFNCASVSYLQSVRYQHGVIKRRMDAGLHVINNAFQ